MDSSFVRLNRHVLFKEAPEIKNKMKIYKYSKRINKTKRRLLTLEQDEAKIKDKLFKISKVMKKIDM